jgi:hypothetical protein
MPRAKSTPGSKTGRAANPKEQSNAAVPQVKPAETFAEASAEAKNNSGSNGASEFSGASELKSNGDSRKFEVVKSEARKNLVPINLEDEIRRRAYEIYEQRGAVSGHEADDWFAAEREVRQRYTQQSA